MLININVADGQTSNGDSDSVYSFSVRIPTMAAAIGYGVIALFVVLSCVGVAVVILWKKGKLSQLKGIKLPKRTKAEG